MVFEYKNIAAGTCAKANIQQRVEYLFSYKLAYRNSNIPYQMTVRQKDE